MCKRMNTTICFNGTVQFTFFLVIRLNITIVSSYDSFIVVFVTSFFEETRPKRRWNKICICQIIWDFFTLNTKCCYVIFSDLLHF